MDARRRHIAGPSFFPIEVPMSLSLSMRLVSTLLAAAALTAQQQVELRGELVDGRATGCYYCPNVGFAIKFSETPVHSTTINLTPFLQQQVQMIANWNGSLSAPDFDVTAITIVTETFSDNGGAQISQNFRFTTHAGAGDLAFNAVAFGHGLVVPFGSLAILLDPNNAVLLGIGVTDGSGEFRTTVQLPNDPALVGLRVFSQGVVAPVNGNPLYGTNPRASFILP
jgi:hypothetical protein